jgi:hypothetical protein
VVALLGSASITALSERTSNSCPWTLFQARFGRVTEFRDTMDWFYIPSINGCTARVVTSRSERKGLKERQCVCLFAELVVHKSSDANLPSFFALDHATSLSICPMRVGWQKPRTYEDDCRKARPPSELSSYFVRCEREPT